MGVGLSNIQNGDGFEKTEKTQATVFLSNPPYSAEDKGFIFTEKALKNMREGYAVVLIQESAGSGQAEECAKRILKISTLRASIHMPPDLFLGKAGVQTSIYVFEAGRPHREDDIVKFIDFSNDGYDRKGRKKGHENLVDINNAKERYEEIINIVTKDKPETCYYTKTNGLFVEDTISLNGKDWTFHLHSKKDEDLQEVDLYQTLSEYMVWKIKNGLRNKHLNDNAGEFDIIWKEFKLEELFEKVQVLKTSGKAGDFPKEPDNGHTIPLLTAGILNQGLSRYASEEQCGTILRNVISISANGENSGTAFYQDEEFAILQDAYAIKIKEMEIPSRQAGLFLAACVNKGLTGKYNWSNKASWNNIKSNPIKIPVTGDGKPDWSYMNDCMVKLEKLQIEKIKTICNSPTA